MWHLPLRLVMWLMLMLVLIVKWWVWLRLALRVRKHRVRHLGMDWRRQNAIGVVRGRKPKLTRVARADCRRPRSRRRTQGRFSGRTRSVKRRRPVRGSRVV